MTLLATWSGSGYSPLAMAQQCALCAMVYGDDAPAIRSLIEPEGELIYYHTVDRSFPPALALIRSGPTHYFAVMEGTVSTAQTIAQGGPYNLRGPFAFQDSVHYTLAGTYWTSAYATLAEAVAQYIPLTLPGLVIHISGHSYGGAVAAIAGYTLAKQGFDRVRVMTFGAPRPFAGTEPVVRPEAYHRVYSATDEIPTYPVKNIGLNLFTVGTPTSWFITNDPWIDCGTPVPLAINGLIASEPNVGLGLYPGVKTGGGAGEHGLANYLARIHQCVDRDL